MLSIASLAFATPCLAGPVTLELTTGVSAAQVSTDAGYSDPSKTGMDIRPQVDIGLGPAWLVWDAFFQNRTGLSQTVTDSSNRIGSGFMAFVPLGTDRFRPYAAAQLAVDSLLLQNSVAYPSGGVASTYGGVTLDYEVGLGTRFKLSRALSLDVRALLDQSFLGATQASVTEGLRMTSFGVNAGLCFNL